MQNSSATHIGDPKPWDFIWHLFMQHRHVRRWLFNRNEPDGSDVVLGLSNNPSLTGFHFSSCPASSLSFSFPPSSSNFSSASRDEQFPDIGDVNTVLSSVDGVILGISYGFKGVHPIIPLIHFATGESQFADARCIVRRTAYTRVEVNNLGCFARIELCWLLSGILLVTTCFEAVDGGPVVDDGHLRAIMPQQVRELISAYEALEDLDGHQNISSVRASSVQTSKQVLNVPEWAVSFEVKEPQRFGNLDITKMVFVQSVYGQTNRIGYELVQEETPQMMHRTEKGSDSQLRSIDEEYATREQLPQAHSKHQPYSFHVQSRNANTTKTGIDEVEMGRYVWYTRGNRNSYPSAHMEFSIKHNETSDNFRKRSDDKHDYDHDDQNNNNNKISETTRKLWAHFQTMNRKARQHGAFHTKLCVRGSSSILQEKESNYIFLCTSHGISIDSRIKELIKQLGLHFSEPATDRLLFSLQNQRRKQHEQQNIERQNIGRTTVVPQLTTHTAAFKSVPLPSTDSGSPNNTSFSLNHDDDRSIIISSIVGSSQPSQSQSNKRAISSSDASNTDHISSMPVSQFQTPSVPISKNTPSKLNKRPRFTDSSTSPQTTQLSFQADSDGHQNPTESDLEGAIGVDPFQAASMGRRLCDEQGHESWECVQCGATIRGKRGNLKRHVLLKHFHVRAFVCNADGCGRRFQNRVNLTRHILNVHQGRPYTCPRCPRTFKLESQMTIHIERAHVDALAVSTGRGEARCDRCGRCFDLVSTLNRHRRTVHGISDQHSMIGRHETQSQTNTDGTKLHTEGEEKNDRGSG